MERIGEGRGGANDWRGEVELRSTRMRPLKGRSKEGEWV